MTERADGRKRRDQILAVTAQALLTQGLRATTTRDIAARIGAGAGLINHYFAFADLRAAAFIAAFQSATQPRSPGNARATLDDFFDFAFHPDADGLWRLWIEAVEMSVTDAALRKALATCTQQVLDELTGTIELGNVQGDWQVADAAAVALRLIALHEGLVGSLQSGLLQLTRANATAHLRAVFELHQSGTAPEVVKQAE